MHKVIASYFRQFVEETELDNLPESEQFEHFVNYCIFSSHYSDRFDVVEVTTGADDFSIDGGGFMIDEELIVTKEEAQQAFLASDQRREMQVTYIFVQAKRSEGFDAGDILKFGDGVFRLLQDGYAPPSDELLQELVSAHGIVVEGLSRVRNGRPSCILYYATTGIWGPATSLTDSITSVRDRIRATGYVHDVEFVPVDRELLGKYWTQTRSSIEATFRVKNYIPFPSIEGVVESYLAVSDAMEFTDQVLSDKDGRIRTSVFDQNVRAYLGDDNEVNRLIRESLKNPSSHDKFAIMNNGITIVSPDVRVQSDRISIRDFQIVNGCQTSHVLHRNRDILTPSVGLTVKVIEANEADIISKLVEATNSQTHVDQSQFLSTRPFVRKLEDYFNSFDSNEEADRRIYFERRTRQYAGSNIGKGRIFDIQRLSRAFTAMFLDSPHLAARFPTQTIREKVDELFRSEHREISYYTAALCLYRLELAMGNNYVPSRLRRFKWHMLTGLKYSIATSTDKPIPAVNSRQMDKFCSMIIDEIGPGGKAAATPFLRVASAVESFGEVSRDRLKRQTFTAELKKALQQPSSE